MAIISGQCLLPAQIDLLLRDQIDPESESVLLRHLDGCRKCQAALEAQAADRELWDELPACIADQTRFFVEDDEQEAEGTPDHGIQDLIDRLAPSDHPNMLGRLGAYEVCGVVGRGSTGIVAKSFEPSLNRYVAIKLLSPTLASSGVARRRFEREARAIAAVVQEHVVPIFAVDEYQGLPYFVMQYVSGASLQHRLDRDGPLGPCEVVRIAMQVASGLSAAHAQGIVHRDIKPANILLEHGLDRVLVSDFGLARVTDGATMTMSGMIAGTPSYMAPEQARGEPIDNQSDLFSLGSVMYAMCTSTPPFRAETVYGVIHGICESQPRPIRESNPETPEWLEAFIMKMLAKPKGERFESAEQVVELLSRELAHLQNPTLVQAPARPWLPTRDRCSRSRSPMTWQAPKFLAASIGALAVLAAVTAVILNNGGNAVESLNAPGGDAVQPTQAGVGGASVGGAGARFTDAEGPSGVFSDEDDQADSFEPTAANAIALAYPVDGIVIDGDPSDWPNDITSHAISRAEAGSALAGSDDLEARFRVGYSAEENAIYVAVEVDDDSYVEEPTKGEVVWNAQDGCEIYVDHLHRLEGSPLAQYTRYGKNLNAFGANEGIEGVDVMVGTNADGSRRCYEWRVRLAEGVTPGKSVGFDLAIIDKDADRSSTWVAWSRGAHKLDAPDRCGAMLFVEKGTKLGTIQGKVEYDADDGWGPRTLIVRSVASDDLWTRVNCQPSGDYAANLPVGEYAVRVADGVDHRYEAGEDVRVTLEPNRVTVADPLPVSLKSLKRTPREWATAVVAVNKVQQAWERAIVTALEGSQATHGSYSPSSENDSIAVAYPIGGIRIDGDLSDWPVDAMRYPVVDCQHGDQPESADDVSASFRVGYSIGDQAIYLAVEVDDDSYVSGQSRDDWAANDGNEVYLDAFHHPTRPEVVQHNFYGEGLQKQDYRVQAVVKSTPGKRLYEWRIRPSEIVAAGRSFGFDLSVLDRDSDGTLSWLGWGKGTQKAWHGDRCGNLLLVEPGAPFGTITGSVSTGADAGRPLPRVCLTSIDSPSLRPRVACNGQGEFTADVPAGRYRVSVGGPAGSAHVVRLKPGDAVVVPPLQLAAGYHEAAE